MLEFRVCALRRSKRAICIDMRRSCANSRLLWESGQAAGGGWEKPKYPGNYLLGGGPCIQLAY